MRFVLSILIIVGSAAWAHAQGRLIVRLKPGIAAGTIAQRHGVTLLDDTAPAPFALYGLRPGQNEDALQLQMSGDPDLMWVEDDNRVSMPEHTGASKGSTIAAISDRNALYSQNTGVLSQIRFWPHRALASGRTVRLAVLDTGLSPQQPRLWDRVVASLNCIEPGQAAWDIARLTDSNNNGVPDEGLGHGTMVTGIVDQVAPRVELIIVRVADSDGIGNAWALVKGLAFAVVNGAEVANISLGSSENIKALNDVLDWTEEQNLLVVAPIGNNGRKMALEPSDNSKVVCVVGLDPVNRKASFSNWDSDADVCAPATGIKSTWHDGTMGVWSGTSFAAPFVSGAVADSLRKSRRLPPRNIRQILKRYGDNVDPYNHSDHRGKIGKKLNVAKLEVYIRRGR